jgi:indolepyruvate ferredoxin oxidoreductase alpha subunit
MSPLVNMVYNKSNVLVVVLDNRITAMTGHQPNPDTGYDGMGEPAKELQIEDIVKACGVENVKVVDPFNMKEMEKTVKEYLNNGELSVIVAKRRCYLLEAREKRRKGIDVTKFQVNESLTPEQKKIMKSYACPAFHKDSKGNISIDETICAGCASCVQIIGPGKIGPKKKSVPKEKGKK